MNVYVDFDGTIANSTKAICDIYNKKYAKHPLFKPAIPMECKKWNMRDVCPLAEHDEIAHMFTTEEFFDTLELYDDAHDVLKKISKSHMVHLVTIGTLMNIHYKAKWCNEKLGDLLMTWHFNGGKTLIMDKSFINNFDSIIIDDHTNNLMSANVPYKICATMVEGEWNSEFNGYKASSWKEIYTAVESLTKNKTYPKQKGKIWKT